MSLLEGPPEKEALSGNLADKMVKNLLKTKERIVEANLRTGRTVTAYTLYTRASVIAQELVTDVKNGVALLYCHSCIEELYAILGCLMATIPLLLMDPFSDRSELKRLLATMQPKVIFSDKTTFENIKKEKFVDKFQRCYIFDDGDNFQKLFRKKSMEEFKPVFVKDPKEIVALMLISEGTTAASRVIMVSHYALNARCNYFMEVLPEGCVSVVSYYGTLSAKLPIRIACLRENITRVIAPPFSAKACVKLLHDMKVDVILLGSTSGHQLLEYLAIEETIKLPRLKQVVFGGVSISFKFMDDLQAVLPNCKIVNIYVSSECGLISFYTRTTDEVHPGMGSCCGKLFPGVKLKITNFITKDVAVTRKWGELWFSGPGLAKGYYNEDFRRQMVNNFFRTGDVAFVDNSGMLYLKGRTQDVLVVNEHVFSTVDIEEALERNEDVIDSACFTRGTHAILLAVTKSLETTAESIFEWLQKQIEPYMLPDKIYTLNHLPKNRSGKVKKYMLKSMKNMKSVDGSQFKLL